MFNNIKFRMEEREAYCALVLHLISNFDMKSDADEKRRMTVGSFQLLVQKTVWPGNEQIGLARRVEIAFHELWLPPPGVSMRTLRQRLLFLEESATTLQRPHYPNGMDKGGFFFLFKCEK